MLCTIAPVSILSPEPEAVRTLAKARLIEQFIEGDLDEDELEGQLHTLELADA